MKLYYHPISTYAQKALIAFYEKSVAFTPELVNLMDEAGRGAYRKIYPLGDERPNIAAYWQRLQARPAIRRVLDEAAPYLAKLQERKSA